MELEVISKERAQGFIKEILHEVRKIRKASEAYYTLVEQEYSESNLYFIKVLSDMFGTDEKTGGIGELANRLEMLCNQANSVLEGYANQSGQYSNLKMEGIDYGWKE